MKPTLEQIENWGKRISLFPSPHDHIRGVPAYEKWMEYETSYKGISFTYSICLQNGMTRLEYVHKSGFRCAISVNMDSTVWGRMEEFISAIEDEMRNEMLQKQNEMAHIHQEAEREVMESMDKFLGKK